MYFIKRKYIQIKKLIRWIPIIWNSFDWDYSYAIKMFNQQLKDTSDYLKSDKANTLDAKLYASKIDTYLKLSEKVYEDDYGLEYQDVLKKDYGDLFDVDINYNIDNNLMLLTRKYEILDISEDEKKRYSDIEKEQLILSQIKQEKAHRILWKYLEHNIQSWWD